MDTTPILLAEQSRQLIAQSKIIIAQRRADLATTREQLALVLEQSQSAHDAYAISSDRGADDDGNGGGCL